MTEEHDGDDDPTLPTVSLPDNGQPDQSGSIKGEFDLLQNVLRLAAVARKLLDNGGFQAVMSEENTHLFQKAADGFYKPFLRDQGKFVENVDLAKLPPDYATALVDASMLLNMAVIADQLKQIGLDVQNLSHVVANQQRGAVDGAVAALASAKSLSSPSERRAQMLSACQMITVNFGGLARQLQSNVRAMPKAERGLLEGFLDNGLERAKNAYSEVQADIHHIAGSVRELMVAYAELGEPGTARVALAEIAKLLREADIESAVTKSRLVPRPKNDELPEKFLAQFAAQLTAIETYLLTGGPGTTHSLIETTIGESESDGR